MVPWVKGLGKFISLSITSGDMSPIGVAPVPPVVVPAVVATVNPNVLVFELLTLSHALTCKLCGPGVKVGS